MELTGTCLCGRVRFEVIEPFERITACHCVSCKKISGGSGTVSGRVRSDAIKIREGRELIGTFQPAEGSAKSFCSVCGSNLFGGGWPASEFSSVRLSTLDREFDTKPEAHIFVRSVAAWETLPEDGAPRYDTRPE